MADRAWRATLVLSSLLTLLVTAKARKYYANNSMFVQIENFLELCRII